MTVTLPQLAKGLPSGHQQAGANPGSAATQAGYCSCRASHTDPGGGGAPSTSEPPSSQAQGFVAAITVRHLRNVHGPGRCC